MSQIYDSTSRYRPHVHWNDQTISPSFEQHAYTNVNKRAQRISLNASLPYHSKLNIRLQTHRNDNHVRATATIRRLNTQEERQHYTSVRHAYIQHYSTLPAEEFRRIQLERFPRHRQISLPISLPIDQRMFLYIHNGEVFARC